MPRALFMILEMLAPLSKRVLKGLGKLCTCFVLFQSFPETALFCYTVPKQGIVLKKYLMSRLRSQHLAISHSFRDELKDFARSLTLDMSLVVTVIFNPIN